MRKQGDFSCFLFLFEMDKNQLRKLMLQKRKGLAPEYVNTASAAILETLIKLSEIEKNSVILSYMPHGNEVDILPLNRWFLGNGKRLCIPRILNDQEMEAVRVDCLETGLSPGSFGIPEPGRECRAVPVHEVDLILVPGLAFDRHGNRLGHGKGYYDRFLKSHGAYTIGIAYKFQLFDHIPTDIHDVRLDAIVTEAGFYPVTR